MLVPFSLFSRHVASFAALTAGILFVISLLAPTASGRQAAEVPRAASVTGRVVEATSGNPMPGANVILRRMADSTLVAGTTTDSLGRFVLEDLPLTSLQLTARFVGYTPVHRKVEPEAEAVTRIETLRMQASTESLDGVDVVGERGVLTTEGGKKVYRIDRSQTNLAGKSTADVLRDLPSVRVSRDGAVSLRGQSDVRLFVNGQPMSLSGKALGQYLRSLSARNVQRIEIDTNPSARYDPEGTAGIIHIVLDRGTGSGWNGSLSVVGGTNRNARGNANVGYRSQRWTAHGTYGYNRSPMDLRQSLTRRDAQGDGPLRLDQVSDAEAVRHGHTFSGQFDIDLTPSTALSLHSTGTIHRSDRVRSTTNAVTASGRRSDTQQSSLNLDERVSLTHTLGADDHQLTGDIRYQRSTRSQEFTDRARAAELAARRGLDEQTENRGDGSIDYRTPLGSATLEAGYDGTYRVVDREHDQTVLQAAPTPPVRSGTDRSLEYRESIHAVYTTLSTSLGDWDVEAGLRAERVDRRIEPFDASISESHSYAFYPSASVTYSSSPIQSFTLSYSKRVNRPSTRQLSFAGLLDDPYERFEGNPDLDPETVHALELSFMQHIGPAMVTLTPYARRTVDAIDWRSRVVGDSLNVRTFDNFAGETSVGVELATSLRIGRTLRGTLGGNVFRANTDGSNLERQLSRDAVAVMGRASLRWTPRPNLDVQLSQFYRSPMDAGLGRMDAFYRTRLSVEQSFWQDRASVGLRVQDPLDTSDMRFVQSTDRFQETMINNWDGRSLSLSLSYRFGAKNTQDRSRTNPSSGSTGMGIMGGG